MKKLTLSLLLAAFFGGAAASSSVFASENIYFQRINEEGNDDELMAGDTYLEKMKKLHQEIKNQETINDKEEKEKTRKKLWRECGELLEKEPKTKGFSVLNAPISIDTVLSGGMTRDLDYLLEFNRQEKIFNKYTTVLQNWYNKVQEKYKYTVE